ncbi:MAG: M28 family peptidase [Anaerolineales bacterium]|nr:M28 family peptidase [Anaerolineales bacterium]
MMCPSSHTGSNANRILTFRAAAIAADARTDSDHQERTAYRMDNASLVSRCASYMKSLCETIPERAVGSEGNRRAAAFIEQELAAAGWEPERQEFQAMDWINGGASLTAEGRSFEVSVSPYSVGFEGTGKLLAISSMEELAAAELRGRILLLHNELAKEQLMPKNFVFYNPDKHQRIIALLEQGSPAALVCATSRNAALAGGVYPFPLIEDGDFDIPSVYMTEEEGQKLLAFEGADVSLKSFSTRVPGTGANIMARKGSPTGKRIVITAHLDAKKGTPGAIDNATGVVVLLLLAQLLKDYDGDHCIEIVALNGEDYYAVPGQMLYVARNQGKFEDMLLNINIDGAGYLEGPSAYSTYQLPQNLLQQVRDVFDGSDSIVEGPQWVQGDHSIFVQFGCPAVALSSLWFTENIDTQTITHTEKDTLGIVDNSRVVEIALALNKLSRTI